MLELLGTIFMVGLTVILVVFGVSILLCGGLLTKIIEWVRDIIDKPNNRRGRYRYDSNNRFR